MMPDGNEKSNLKVDIRLALGFRFMGKSLGELLELKASLRKRLAFLEENRARISPFVLHKLSQEYKSYLETVDSELALNLCEYEIKLSELRLFSSQLQLLRKAYSDNIEEIRLRHILGEYGPEEFARLTRDHEERMRIFEENLARYDSEERRIQAFLEQTGFSSAEAVAGNVAAPSKPAPAAPPAQAEPALKVELQPPQAEPKAKVDIPAMPAPVVDSVAGPVSEPVLEAPAEPKTAPAPSAPPPAAARLELRPAPAPGQKRPPAEVMPSDISELMGPSPVTQPSAPEPLEAEARSETAGLPGLEEIFGAAAPDPAPEMAIESEAVSQAAPEIQVKGQAASPEELFESLLQEQSASEVEPEPEIEAVEASIEAAPAAPEPSAPAESLELEITLDQAPAVDGTVPAETPSEAQNELDSLDLDLLQIQSAATGKSPAAEPEQLAEKPDSAAPAISFDLDLEALMEANRAAEPVSKAAPAPPPEVEIELPQSPAAEAEPEPESEPDVEMPAPVTDETKPQAESEEEVELRWEPLSREDSHEIAAGPVNGVSQPDKAGRRTLPLDGKIELTLDLDRTELDPQKILTVNQTIDAIKKKTVKCPNCGTMNYAIRWYCENCEATLTTL